jgi:hypothetical protein
MSECNCDKFALLATLESQLAILIHAQEEYGRCSVALAREDTEMASRMLAVTDQHYASLTALLDKARQEHTRVQSQGGKHCTIDFDNEGIALCRPGRDEDKEDICEHPVFGHELDEGVPLPSNLWASCSADTQLG